MPDERDRMDPGERVLDDEERRAPDRGRVEEAEVEEELRRSAGGFATIAGMAPVPLRRDEVRIVLGAGGVYALRMLGLYMALPLLATWVAAFPGATHLHVGFCLGAYGLTQALFQVPLGVLGDLAGRRFVIVLSLLVFAAGSALAASATSVEQAILGRLVQGAGAMASTIVALVGDTTREEVRARAVALLGLPLGVAFGGGFVAGPIAAARFGVPAIFWVACALSTASALLFGIVVPRRLVAQARHAAARGAAAAPAWSWADASALARDPSLLVLDAGIGVLHACITGILVVVPFLMRERLADGDLWRVYAPVVAVGMAAMAWASHVAERPERVGPLMRLGAALLALALAALAALHAHFAAAAAALALFVAAFGILEPVLVAQVTRAAKPAARGTAAGLFSLAQFAGAFAGGLLAGRLLDAGRGAPFAALAVLAAAWLALVVRSGAGAPPPRR
jgi:MFS family permease